MESHLRDIRSLCEAARSNYGVFIRAGFEQEDFNSFCEGVEEMALKVLEYSAIVA
jgi:hypothetical protein